MHERSARFGNWTVEDVLGRGDFATVYRVTSNGTAFALKACANDNEAARERLELEQTALEALDHPNIPRLESVGVQDGRAYLVMSLAPGKTLLRRFQERHQDGALEGDIRALEILVGLLDALAHVHERGLVHRDVKDANVLAPEHGPGVTLIDFGFCKKGLVSETRSSDSFWRAGAPRFSPPSKLLNPGRALPTHDVFAVGVIGYKLLAGEFPWSVEHEDVGALRTLQLTHALEPVVEKNSHVLAPVSQLIMKMLNTTDSERPTAAEALSEARSVLDTARSGRRPLTRGRPRIVYPHAHRDPIYGDIWLTDYEQRVIDTPEMQRLRFIKQLGLTNRIYSGAQHDRFSHSIGCVHRVEQILHTIETQEGIRISDDLRHTARLYALVHDVTHIPFGHTLEDEFGFFLPHDKNPPRVDRLLHRTGSRLGQVLRADEVGRAVLSLFSTDRPGVHTAAADMVSGLAGADVLDYIDRDAFHCGLRHRIDDAIFRQFHLQPLPRSEYRTLVSVVGGKYGLRIDHQLALKDLLNNRYAMFLKVYAHRSKLALSSLLAKGLTEALYGPGGRSGPLREESLEKLGVGDENILAQMSASKRPTVRWAAEQILLRRMPIAAYRTPLLESDDRTETNYADRQAQLRDQGLFDLRQRAAIEERIAVAARLDPRNVMIYCTPAAPGFKRMQHRITSGRDDSPPTQPPDIGKDVKRQHLGLWELWVFLATGHEDAAGIVADVAQSEFGFPNVIDTRGRGLRAR